MRISEWSSDVCSSDLRPLAQAPERPQIELAATLGNGDSFARLLERSGVGRAEALALAQQVSAAVPLADIAPGTRIDLILGRRAARTMPRPVEEDRKSVV